MTETEDYDKSTAPTLHSSTHESEGVDVVSIQDLAGVAAAEQKSAWDKVSGKPATFPPSAHKTSHQNGGADKISIASLSGEAADEQKSAWAKVSGKPATFPPSAHKTSHQNGGADEVSIASLSGEAADEQKSSWAKVSGKPTTFIHSTAVVAANKVIVGDDGARNVKGCDIAVSVDGEMTNPSQPAFHFRPSVNQSNIARNTNVTVLLASERFDVGNNFADNTFTAPLTAKYLLSINLVISQVDIDAAYYSLSIITSNRTYLTRMFPKYTADAYLSMSWLAIVDMDINDTAYLCMYQSGGLDQTDILTYTHFSGMLSC